MIAFRSLLGGALSLGLACVPASLSAAVILNVVETGGDNEATDTITAKWTGQTWNATVANEPITGITVGTPFTLGTFGSGAPAFVDRNHRYFNDAGTGLNVPAYLVGSEYIMSGNDNRDNPAYRLDVTVSSPVRVFMLIDNRLSDGNGADPPTFGPTAMQWILDDGWTATSNGLNRAANSALPDEVPFDEGANDTIEQYYSVYQKDFGTGTFSLFQPDNAGRNMYGAVVTQIPEMSSLAMAGLGLLGLAARRRRP